MEDTAVDGEETFVDYRSQVVVVVVVGIVEVDMLALHPSFYLENSYYFVLVACYPSFVAAFRTVAAVVVAASIVSY